MSSPGIIFRVVDADDRGGDQQAHLVGERLVIGRHRVEADLVIPGQDVSLKHALLRWVDGAFYIEPHPEKGPASAPLLVDGAEVLSPTPLRAHQVVSIAGLEFIVDAVGQGVTAPAAAQGRAVEATPSLVAFGQGGGGRVELGEDEAPRRNVLVWVREHWPLAVAAVAVLVGGVVWAATRPEPPPPAPAAPAPELCDHGFRPALTDSCTSVDDCVKKAEAAQARAVRKAETGAVGYEVLGEALTAIHLADRAGTGVDVDRARAFAQKHTDQLVRLCRGVRLEVMQAYNAGNRGKAFRACRSLFDAVPNPADPRYVWARKCMVDFAE